MRVLLKFAFGELGRSMLYVIEKSGQIQHNLVNSYSLGCTSTGASLLTSPSPIIITHLFTFSTLPFFWQPMSTIYQSLFSVFLEFYCVRARCTCIFSSFFQWWKVSHGLGLGFWGCLWHDADVPLFEGGTWSRSSWQMSYSIHWCSGSYIGVWGSVTDLDTS